MIDLYSCDADDVTEADVRAFVTTVIDERLHAENHRLEFKSTNQRMNVAKAVAALSNTIGGLVIVGVDEGADEPVVGIPPEMLESIAQVLRQKLPGARYEMIERKLSGTMDDRVVCVLRVDADSVDAPLVLDGCVYVRTPKESIGARRDEIWSMFGRNGLAVEPNVQLIRNLSRVEILQESHPEVAVAAGAAFLLPRQRTGLRRIGDAGLDEIEERLRELAIPGEILPDHLGLTTGLRSHAGWRLVAQDLKMVRYLSGRSSIGQRFRPQLTAALLVALSERTVEVALSIGADPDEVDELELTIDVVFELFVVAALAALQIGQAVSSSIGAGTTPSPPHVSWSIGGRVGLDAVRLVKDHRLRRDFDDEVTRGPMWDLAPHPIEKVDPESVGDLAREALIDLIQGRGFRGSEAAVTNLPLPAWTSRFGADPPGIARSRPLQR